MSDPTPAQRADLVRRYYDDGLCSRDAAIREIRSLLDLTDAHAADLLDHPQMPSERYAALAEEWS